MKSAKFALPLVFLLGLSAFLVYHSAFIVDETEQVIITQFGRPIGNAIQNPGLHFRIPFIQDVRVFEKRILHLDGEAERINTRDKRYLYVDTTARYRIVDPLKFLQSFPTGLSEAEIRLGRILNSKVLEVIPQHNVIEIVRSSNAIFEEIQEEAKKEAKAELDMLSEDAAELEIRGERFSSEDQKVERIREGRGRDFVKNEIFIRSKPLLLEFGVDLIDMRIKRVNYDRDVREEVYQRMRSERERDSSWYRSRGEGIKREIEGMQGKEVERIRSEAMRLAEGVRGKADAEATRIYAEAYSKDPEFYSFLLTLESYKQTLSRGTRLILSTENDYLRYLKATDTGGVQDNPKR